jgi:LPXTG-motif cell wall-anchored protein
MRRLFLAALLGVMFFGMSASAFAATYPPSGPTAGSSSAAVSDGGTLTLTGQGWLPGSQVDLTLFSTPVPLGTATVAADGSFTKTVTIPSSTPPGNHTIVMSGRDANGNPATQSISITVKAAGTASGSNAAPASNARTSGFASTGAQKAASMTFVGVTLLLFGGVLVIVFRRRHAARAMN